MVIGHQSLIRAMALGAVISLAGSTGIFAIFSDRAFTGTNSVTTGARPTPPPDVTYLRIAETSNPGQYPVTCGTFSDDIATGLFTISDFQVGSYPYSIVCLENAGTTTLSLSATTLDLVDTDTGCSVGEAEAGDSSCGGDQLGELSYGLWAFLNRPDCASGYVAGGAEHLDLATMRTSSLAIPGDALTPGEIACVYVGLGLVGDETLFNLTQSDQVSWRFAFWGTTP